MSENVWNRLPKRSSLPDIEIKPSTNLTRPEHGEAPKPPTAPTRAEAPAPAQTQPKPEVARQRASKTVFATPGSRRKVERYRGSAGEADVRAMAVTGRVKQLSTKVTEEWNDEARALIDLLGAEQNYRYKYGICHLLEDALAAFKEKLQKEGRI